jgi:hypothetical protein
MDTWCSVVLSTSYTTTSLQLAWSSCCSVHEKHRVLYVDHSTESKSGTDRRASTYGVCICLIKQRSLSKRTSSWRYQGPSGVLRTHRLWLAPVWEIELPRCSTVNDSLDGRRDELAICSAVSAQTATDFAIGRVADPSFPLPIYRF